MACVLCVVCNKCLVVCTVVAALRTMQATFGASSLLKVSPVWMYCLNAHLRRCAGAPSRSCLSFSDKLSMLSIGWPLPGSLISWYGSCCPVGQPCTLWLDHRLKTRCRTHQCWASGVPSFPTGDLLWLLGWSLFGEFVHLLSSVQHCWCTCCCGPCLNSGSLISSLYVTE